MSNDGSQVSNVFVYDEQGRPVPQARLFDEAGRPLVVRPEEERVAPADEYGRQQPNVVPRAVAGGDPWHPTQEVLDRGEQSWRPPASLPSLLAEQPTATISPSASPTTTTGPTPPTPPPATSPTTGPSGPPGATTAPTPTASLSSGPVRP
ncbi:hypothetical protein [Arsenicicoccus sp. oral taxon 190]|uniref:hypothetical protein n=1 Tax=Arsenicicoccus sp. oral taxon 190 TaxID=1658671 RepID=UPI00067A3ED5|nr:hypothetical protein [Arsenicicoccus sp. oral taxon 190]AKT50179.1 hypothetical protein ADJ73_00475 [Arsenicicoccus sp. oral taxon 190]